MKEILSAEDASWIEDLPTEKPVPPVVASTASSVSDVLAKHTVPVVDEFGKPTWISVVLLADVIFWDDK